jgi:hypothetical protein
MEEDLERIWKKESVVYSRYYPIICEETEKSNEQSQNNGRFGLV